MVILEQTLLPLGANYISTKEATQMHCNSASGQIIFKVAPTGTSGSTISWTTAMTIDNSGNVLVGKIVAGIANAGCHFSNGGNSIVRSGGTVLDINRQGSDGNIIAFYNDGSNVGTISTSGSSTAYNTSSDYRLKENVVTDWDATTRLKQLKPSRFKLYSRC